MRARHLGFLHGKPKEWPKNRWDKCVSETGFPPRLPPIEAGEHVYNAFLELEKVASNGFGLMPISWTEIDAYARLTGEIRTPLEAQLVRNMSKAYIEGLEHAKNEFAREPWEDGS
ncbi:hypothetical protein NBRC116590_02720 [Pelagimonas sp. KU-00592-HH]